MFLIGSKSHPDDSQSSLDKAEGTKEPLFSARALKTLVSLIVISFLAALISTGWEITELAKSQVRSGTTGHLAVAQGGQKVSLPPPPVHPVHFFPKSVPAFTVFGRQKVRGEEANAAEAIFKPEDEQYSLVEPQNVYVKIAYYGSDDAAQKAIDRVMSHRKINDRISISVNGIGTSAGYTGDHGSLIIAWVKNGYAVEIDASYTQIIPTEKTGSLEKNAVVIAKEILARMAGNQD
ncbi:MAG: hypothetical protein IBX64_09585 [Actinobacteria bacterium]|nr:hypothetical protein [Actinomycetota bacterium]